ncbi:MAG: phosphatase PAP2 family protein [Paucibacter sp.]|nr:phosphatase PAP2 family protein [Roseateles sp.]
MLLPSTSPILAGPPDLVAWNLITRLGDAELLLPLVPLAALWLWLGAGQGALASRWTLRMALTAGLTVATKIAFFGWQIGVADWDFTGVSGHAMFACASYPMLIWTVLMNRSRPVQLLGVGAGALLGVLIAYSRLPVQAHSASEVLVGAGLGLWVSLSCVPLQRSGPALPAWSPVVAAVLLGLMVVAAPPSRTGGAIEQISMQLSGKSRAYTRDDLRRLRVELHLYAPPERRRLDRDRTVRSR